MPGKFALKTAKNGQVSFTLKASNGEVLLTSERYAARKNAKRCIAAVQRNAVKRPAATCTRPLSALVSGRLPNLRNAVLSAGPLFNRVLSGG